MNVADLTMTAACDEDMGDDPCGRPAVALRRYEGEPYPVCRRHTRGDLLTLPEVLAFVREQRRPCTERDSGGARCTRRGPHTEHRVRPDLDA